MMNKKAQFLQQNYRKRQPQSIRRKSHKIQTVSVVGIKEPAMLMTMGFDSSVGCKNDIDFWKEESTLFVAPSNKIYNADIKTGQVQNLGPCKQLRASLNKIGSVTVGRKEGRQERPQSTQGNKLMMNSEIFKINRDVLNYENRPGSSKSSRLFKRKGIITHDTINSQNEESEALERTTSIGCNRPVKVTTTTIGSRNRAATSLSHKQRVQQKIPSKIDADFFGLFAQ